MKYTLWVALLLAIIGGVSGYYFQDMFYWAGHSFFWFNVGAALAFVCSLTAIGLVISTILKKNFATQDMLLLVVILPVAIGTLFWTTFVYAMWHG